MTPAINLIKKAKIPHSVHEYTHEARCESYGLEAANKLGVEAKRVFKTLVVSTELNELVVGVIPVSSKLNMKLIAKAAKSKKVKMAEQAQVERATGYVLGGVSPLGQKKRLKTFIDVSAQQYESIYVSAGRRGLEIELCPKDLIKLVSGDFMPLSQS